MTRSPEDEPAADGTANILALQGGGPAAANAAALQNQYEAFPYPPKDGATESDGLRTGSPSHILEIDHYIYGGERNWTKPFRALVAGGGTGDAAIMLGQQCADIGCPAEIIYLDLSAASMAIARNRAQERGLNNIIFHQGSLLGVADYGWQPFDYIDCCGVLHHLASPENGLAALVSVLHPEGGLGLMLYGAFGRTGIYDVQEIMRGITAADEDQAAQLPLLRKLLDHLPASNRLVRNPGVPHDGNHPDAELVDKFLHPQDRAYTVPDIAALCADSGLKIASFAPAGRYDPATYLVDNTLRARFNGLGLLAKAALAERIAGNIAKHILYAVPSGRPNPRPGLQPNAIPVLKHSDGATLARKISADTAFQARFDDLTVVAAAPSLTAEIMRRIDNQTSLEDIYFDMVSDNPGLNWNGFIVQIRELYGALHGLLNAMFLRYENDGPPFKKQNPIP